MEDKRQADFDRSKAGLQDDHDPSDPAQKRVDKPGGVKPKSNEDRASPKTTK